MIKLLEAQLRSHPRRRRPKEAAEEVKKEVVEPVWPVWKVKRRFVPWASWETPSLIVSGSEATLSQSIIISCRRIRVHEASQLFNWPQISTSILEYGCVSSFQQLVGLQEVGLRFVLPWCADGLPNGGSASPFSRLLLGVHWRCSFCSSAGGPASLTACLFPQQLLQIVTHVCKINRKSQ